MSASRYSFVPRWLAACLLPPALVAQTIPAERAIELEAVEVTSQKRIQSIRDVPIAVTAYDGGSLRGLGVTRYEDLAPFVPGLFVQEQSPNNPGINIRGVTTDSGDPRSETRVSIFQDGVSISRSRGSVVELFDLERVEVLKGPQGTLFGRGAEIGAVALIQQKARDETSAQLQAGVGNFNHREAEGYFNASLVPQQLFGRVAFRTVERDGAIENLADDSNLNGRDTVALRGSLRWQPSARTTADLIFNYQRDTPPGTAFKSGSIPTPGGDTSPFTAAALTRGQELGIDRTVWGLTALFQHELNDAWSFTSISGWREFDSFEHFDADGSIVPLLEFAEDATGRQVSQEFRFNFDTGGRFVGFAGAGYFRESGTQRVPFYAQQAHIWPFLSGNFRSGLIAAGVPAALVNAAIPPVNPFVAVPNLPATLAAFGNPALPANLRALAPLAGAPLGPHLEDYANFGRTEALDAFVDGTWRATGRLEFNAGLRLTQERIKSGYEARNLSGSPALIGFILNSGTNVAFRPTEGRREEREESDGWAGRLTATYRLTPQLNAYGSASRGRRPEAVVLDATTTTRLEEEVIWHYEIGVKGTAWNQRLNYGAALFSYDYANFQTSIADPGTPGRFISTDAGNATGRGAELTAQATLAADLKVFSSYGYTDATFDDTGDDGQPQEFAGFRFRLTAKHTFALGLLWEHALADAGAIFVSPVYQYKSAHYFDDNNALFDGALRQDAFGLVNLRGGWRSPDRRWQIEVWTQNLLDEDYLIDAGNTGGSFGIPTFVAGSPRLYGVNVAFRW